MSSAPPLPPSLMIIPEGEEVFHRDSATSQGVIILKVRPEDDSPSCLDPEEANTRVKVPTTVEIGREGDVTPAKEPEQLQGIFQGNIRRLEEILPLPPQTPQCRTPKRKR